MQHLTQQRHSVVSKLFAMVFTLCLGLSGAERAVAAADPYDEHSVTMGSQLYELYCSDCHGAATADRYGELYDTVQMEVSDDYAELVDLVRGAEAPERYVAPQEDWPEWADNPAPEREPDVRAEVLGSVSRAIDTIHGSSQNSDTLDNWGNGTGSGNASGFDPVPGATNLADPTAYFYGLSEEEMFNSIANGTGAAMPGWRTELGSDEAVWDLVNYIRSQWGEAWRY
jgi:mono/diheme cytochrome c family protein